VTYIEFKDGSSVYPVGVVSLKIKDGVLIVTARVGRTRVTRYKLEDIATLRHDPISSV
jgi:hypothetical protein